MATTGGRIIESLTPEQEVLLERWHSTYLAHGVSTERSDRPRAEAAISALYAEVGCRHPRFLWVESPVIAMQPVAPFSSDIQEEHSLGDSLRNSLGDSLRNSLWNSLWNSLGNSLRNSLRNSLGDSLRNSLWNSLGDSLGNSLWNSLGDSLGNSLWNSLGGQHDLAWVAFYRFGEQLGVVYDPKRARQLHFWDEVGQSCCWLFPYRNICIVSERPTVCKMEPVRLGAKEYRLHCETGPALAFADGWMLYSWHGIRVPAQVIEAPDTLTIKQIHEQRNAEVRRIMIERFGRERYVRDADAELIDMDDWGKLWQIYIPGGDLFMVVEVVNSTPEPDGSFKNYFLRVDPRCCPMRLVDGRKQFGRPQKLTALNAVASTFGMTGKQYAKIGAQS